MILKKERRIEMKIQTAVNPNLIEFINDGIKKKNSTKKITINKKKEENPSMIKRCPFCGNIPEVKDKFNGYERGSSLDIECCNNIKISEDYREYDFQTYHPVKEEARKQLIEKWNTRSENE
jgi:hypothetical protein